jgi:hypothetical protein
MLTPSQYLKNMVYVVQIKFVATVGGINLLELLEKGASHICPGCEKSILVKNIHF